MTQWADDIDRLRAEWQEARGTVAAVAGELVDRARAGRGYVADVTRLGAAVDAERATADAYFNAPYAPALRTR